MEQGVQKQAYTEPLHQINVNVYVSLPCTFSSDDETQCSTARWAVGWRNEWSVVELSISSPQ